MIFPGAAGGGVFSQLNAWDTEAFLFLNGLHSTGWDGAMSLVSSVWVLVPVHLLLILGIVHRPRWRECGALAALALFIVLIDLSGVHAIKEFAQRLRPSWQAELSSVVHLVGGHRGGMYGFISTHTAYAFALATFAAMAVRGRLLAVVLFVWALVVGYSRVYMGLHFPGDVLGGAVWGMSVAAGVSWVFSRSLQWPERYSLAPVPVVVAGAVSTLHETIRPDPVHPENTAAHDL
jgi:undecaprenyl-diphosphatase